MVNYNHTWTDLAINLTTYTNANNATVELVNSANDTTQGFWGLGILFIFFIATFYSINRNDGFFRLDALRSFVFSSGISLILGVLLLTLAITTSYRHTVWFAILFVISLIMVFFLKRRA